MEGEGAHVEGEGVHVLHTYIHPLLTCLHTLPFHTCTPSPSTHVHPFPQELTWDVHEKEKCGMFILPYDKGDKIFDNLFELVWVCVGELLLGWVHLGSEDCPADCAQLVLRGHAEQGTVKEVVLLPILIILTPD